MKAYLKTTEYSVDHDSDDHISRTPKSHGKYAHKAVRRELDRELREELNAYYAEAR